MKYTNTHNLPDQVCQALKFDDYDHNPDPMVISATTLIGPPRIRLLKLKNADKLQQDVMDLTWVMMGRAVHYVLETMDNQAAFVEERLSYEFDGIGMTITGKSDRFEDVVTDYKNTSAWTLVYGSRIKEWTEQLNIYSFLWRMSGFEPKGLQAICILRDWQKSKVGGNYPDAPIKVVKLEQWDLMKQREYIKGRLEIHKAAMGWEMPLCTPEERWAEPTKYAIYKNKNKTATKVCASQEEAEKKIEDLKAKDKKKATYRVEVREGSDRRCPDYCLAMPFCDYGNAKYGKKGGNDGREKDGNEGKEGKKGSKSVSEVDRSEKELSVSKKG